MEHLSLEIFDREGTGSRYATLPEDASISITDTSEIFASGDVWSHSFTLNVRANAHIFGTSGEVHGSRLHEQINKRRARLWVEGLPLYLGYLKLDDEVEVDEDGNVDVSFESGQKMFDEMIEGASARDVSVGDVVIGVALNRKRLLKITHIEGTFKPQIYKALGSFGNSRDSISSISDKNPTLDFKGGMSDFSPYTHRWPKLVLSKGVVNNLGTGENGTQVNYTNVQEPYSDSNPFCNINISYQKKIKSSDGNENTLREYTIRLAYGEDTTLGGDNQTRFNNAPNFYLLHWLKRLFVDLGIHIEENQMLDVEDLKRVFLANLGCFYEEMDLNNDVVDNYTKGSKEWERYGKFSFPENFIRQNHTFFQGDEDQHKALIHRIESERFGNHSNSLTGEIVSIDYDSLTIEEKGIDGYLAYATGDNYPNVDISEIIKAVESAFGVRFLFDNDFRRVRIVLLRNIFRDSDIQNLSCDIISDSKQENSIRGFKMTYGADKDDTTFFYKGFDDMLPKKKEIWKDRSDTHDYSQWALQSDYADVLTKVTSFNKTCYVTPVNGNAYGVKIDENEDIFFPTLFEYAGYMDAEDGDCTGEEETIETVTVNAKPLIMNVSDGIYSVLHTGDMKAPGETTLAALMPVLENHLFETPVIWYTNHGGDSHETRHQEKAKIWADIFIKEGYKINLQDNYDFTGNDGTSFDKADIGLCFGIMRGSGDDAYVKYEDDEIENEDNQWWESVPGSGAVCHPDTCNSYGDLWDYNGADYSYFSTAEGAAKELQKLFPESNAPFRKENGAYITAARLVPIEHYNFISGKSTLYYLMVERYSDSNNNLITQDYIDYLTKSGIGFGELYYDKVKNGGKGLVIEAKSNIDRRNTLLDLCRKAYDGYYDDDSEITYIDNGVGSRYGRFSLKLRAEKPNPYFDVSQPESDKNRRYLDITNDNLKGRGLADQFYKEYSYWVRNARIIKCTVRMNLAQLLTIDKTKRVQIGDITGFVKKMQYSVSNKTGLGNVTMEIMYI